jgi:hypothetical protein
MRALPWVLLAVSVTGNAYLVLRSPPPAGVVTPKVEEGPILSTMPERSTASAREKSPARAEAPAAKAQIQDLEQQIQDLQQKLAALRSNTLPHPQLMKQAFESGQPNPLAQSRLEREIQRLLVKDGGTLPWTLSCRGEVCRLEVALTRADQGAWRDAMGALQTDPKIRSLASTMGFERGELTVDALSGEDVREQRVFMSLASEEEAAARERFFRFVSALRETSAVKDCTNGYQHHGALEVKLQPGPVGNVQVLLAGSLMRSPAAECLRTRFEREATAAPAGLLNQIPDPFFSGAVIGFSSPPREAP